MPPPGPTIFEYPMDLTTDPTGTISLHALEKRLIHRVATVRQDLNKRMKLLQRRIRDDHGRQTFHAPLSFTARQYIYLHWPPMTTSAAQRLATEPFRELMASQIGPFNVV